MARSLTLALDATLASTTMRSAEVVLIAPAPQLGRGAARHASRWAWHEPSRPGGAPRRPGARAWWRPSGSPQRHVTGVFARAAPVCRGVRRQMPRLLVVCLWAPACALSQRRSCGPERSVACVQ